MENFTPWLSTVGGILIGISATMMLMLHGRVTGISGILGQAMTPSTAWTERRLHLLFLAGLLAGGILFLWQMPTHFELGIERSPLALVIAGLLVGFGTRLGSGCTSGHGVCGLSRLSRRSTLATVTFMTTGAVTVFVVRTLFGGTV